MYPANERFTQKDDLLALNLTGFYKILTII
jgi:hypothetical protein